ncbi:hypothetical protein GCM10027590_38410 [Nocardiopsis nanhaiensis]
MAAISVGHHRSGSTVVALRVSGALGAGAVVFADGAGDGAPVPGAPVFCVPEFREPGMDAMPTRLRRCGSGGQA